MQGATVFYRIRLTDKKVSIHAPYAGSDKKFFMPIEDLYVSIHAPYAGSDDGSRIQEMVRMGVSIHAPYAGSDCNFSQKFFLIFSRNRQIIILNT